MMWWEFLTQKAWILEMEEFNWNAEAFLCRVNRYLMLCCSASSLLKGKKKQKGKIILLRCEAAQSREQPVADY